MVCTVRTEQKNRKEIETRWVWVKDEKNVLHFTAEMWRREDGCMIETGLCKKYTRSHSIAEVVDGVF